MTSRRVVLPLLLVFLLPAAACESTAPTEPDRGVTVSVAASRSGQVALSGRVTDYRTGAAMAGAVVSFRTFDIETPLRQVVADASGVYAVELPGDEYLVLVDGVLATSLLAVIPSTRAHIIARAAGCSALYGFVGDGRAGEPLAGVRVSSLGLQTTTDAMGWYLIDWGCEPGGGFGTSVATFTRTGYDDVVQVIGRGRPNGAHRLDVGMVRSQ